MAIKKIFSSDFEPSLLIAKSIFDYHLPGVTITSTKDEHLTCSKNPSGLLHVNSYVNGFFVIQTNTVLLLDQIDLGPHCLLQSCFT